MPAPILMVHGAFSGGWSFDAFKTPFVAAGHPCSTPDLPGHGADSATVASFSMTDYASAIAAQIERSPQPPIVIGHSMGGLVALMAAARAKVSGLVLIAPSSPWGIAANTLEGAAMAFGMIGLNAYWGQAVPPDRQAFEALSVDRMAEADRKAIFARLGPESGRAISETINWWLDPSMTTRVSPEDIDAPVLLLAGGRDHVQSLATLRQTAERYSADLEVFPQMSHWLIGEPGWEAVADAALSWIPGALRAAA